MFQCRIHSIIKKLFLSLCFTSLTLNNLYSQQQFDASSLTLKEKDSLIKVYGLDPLLYNGLLYKSFYPSNVKGDQFFLNSDYIQGEATIRGAKYKNLDLNFDIYKQEVLLKYLNTTHSYNTIMLSKTWLEEFSIGNCRFIFYATNDIPKRIYQVLGKDSLQILYYWKKDLKLDNVTGNKSFRFIPRREQYLLINHSLNRYYRNNSFIHLFSKEKQGQIKKYLRKNKIKVFNAQDQIMEELINYCSKLSAL